MSEDEFSIEDYVAALPPELRAAINGNKEWARATLDRLQRERLVEAEKEGGPSDE